MSTHSSDHFAKPIYTLFLILLLCQTMFLFFCHSICVSYVFLAIHVFINSFALLNKDCSIPGTVAFLRSISVEALGLGVHLAAGAHEILLHAECILARIQPSIPRPIKSKLKANLITDRPEDAQRGLQQVWCACLLSA